mmetsp:Transcript_39116/g.43658  ORF Transcript_39116/g.43658 Transcript_39116/m.43658 type:complete len:185 (+) Transcript_39116:74-628(+)
MTSSSSSFNLSSRNASITASSLSPSSSSRSSCFDQTSRIVSFDGQQSLSAFKKSPAATTTTSSQNHVWSVIEGSSLASGPQSSTIQYDHENEIDNDNDTDDDDTNKLYYSDVDDRMMGEDHDDNEYEYEDYHEEDDDDDDMMMIDYNMTYTEADDDARFCQVTTDAEMRKRSHKKTTQVGKYRK